MCIRDSDHATGTALLLCHCSAPAISAGNHTTVSDKATGMAASDAGRFSYSGSVFWHRMDCVLSRWFRRNGCVNHFNATDTRRFDCAIYFKRNRFK